MSYNPYGGAPYGAPPGYGGYPPMNMNAPPGMVAPPGLGPPPGMSSAPGMMPPGMAPPGIHNANTAQANRQSGLPMGFQPPANMPNINFNARVIRLGTSNSKPATNGTKDADTPTSATPTSTRQGADRTEQNRANTRESIQALVPPTQDEKMRTIFINKIPEGVGSAGMEALLNAVGKLKRWDSTPSVLSEGTGLHFGFAQFEDADSVATAIEVLKDVKVPTKKQATPETMPTDEHDEFEGIDKTTLQVFVDPLTTKYLESHAENKGPDANKDSRIEAAKTALKKAIRNLFYPPATSKPDNEGEAAEAVEVVNINVSLDDELADIPANVREMVAGEIAAFRERSNQRDIERLKREEEIEERERNRTNGRNRSPHASIRGAPLGPKNATGSSNGASRIAFISSGLSQADLNLYRDYDDTDASDEELNRRELKKKADEQDAAYADAERRWVGRERSRTAALERERDRERDDAESQDALKREVLKHEAEWDDEKERSRKVHPYYRDHASWVRKRAQDRADEQARDEADRQMEADEQRREKKEQDKARGMADSFLEQQSKELSVPAAPVAAPQPFKLSLGAAAQKAQAQRNGPTRRTVAEVEGLLDDEENDQRTKRQLIPIQFEPVTGGTEGMTEEEIQAAVKQLAQEIPTEKEELWKWTVKWDQLHETIITDKLRPFVEKKIVEYLGVQEEVIVDVIEEHLRKHGTAEALVEELSGALDDEAEDLVKKLWRMVIFFTESEKRGLPA
ncbi:hypothetical protein TD95_001249 [Thielaviopsis punctulata]|uniref:PWI domain-containing protein n=1 Tax=Thielaviopsis punctulata TaxID=72032 RepID=A0A0F4ZAX3_9PEZI|nr:hypothetical protein TD95_001249 [Thielaviopsis punctulata]